MGTFARYKGFTIVRFTSVCLERRVALATGKSSQISQFVQKVPKVAFAFTCFRDVIQEAQLRAAWAVLVAHMYVTGVCLVVGKKNLCTRLFTYRLEE